MSLRRIVIFLLLLVCSPGVLFGQNVQRRASEEAAMRMIVQGDSLHRAYRFQEAISRYMGAFGTLRDPVRLREIDQKITASQNALNMTDFCAEPQVVARQRFSHRDFFLFYPLKPQSWHPSPNPLDSLEGMPTFLPRGEREVWFSAADDAGSRNIYYSEDRDTLWSTPTLVGEDLLSTGNEIFPMLSPDGKSLYFASDGLYGMGGYDLYVSRLDESTGRWGMPENLGFPFNSPADDFLLVDTEDGKYTIFASNRDCGPDSVYVYVLEYDARPARRAIRSADDLARIAHLLPMNDPSRLDNASAVAPAVPDNDDTRNYMRKMDESRALRDSIYTLERELDQLRRALGVASDAEKAALTASIHEKEEGLEPLRRQLDETNLEIRRIEQNFLRSGAVTSGPRADRQVVGASSAYTFTKNSMGGRLRIRVGRRRGPSGSFRITPVGRFAQDNTLPDGLVFQIELFTSVRHASLDDIRGLNPVYERMTSNLRYTYSVGIFSSYSEALEHLNTVRRLGFREAHIVAWRDGRPVSVFPLQ